MQLKYGFSKKSLFSEVVPQSDEKSVQPEVHSERSNFLQNPYFRAGLL